MFANEMGWIAQQYLAGQQQQQQQQRNMENITAGTVPKPPLSAGALAASTGLLGMLLDTFGLSTDLTSLTSLFLVISLAWQYLGSNFTQLSSLITSSLYSSLVIRQEEWEVFNQFLDWMQDQPFVKASRNLAVGMQPDRYFDIYDEDNEDEQHGREYCFTPCPGWHIFWFNNRPIFLNRRLDDTKKSPYGWTNEDFELYTIGRSPDLLKALLEAVRQQHLHKDASKTVVYRDGGLLGKENGWKRCYSRHSRPLSTVVLDEAQKTAFVQDVKDYLLPATARWYGQRGIPYRRGYLFYGPPGTGKSSLSFAAAGLFGLRIYVINLASTALTEDHLCTLFSALPRQCIVLLEDIDAAFLDRSAVAPPAPKQPKVSGLSGLTGGKSPAAAPEEPEKPKTGVSFSGLLNALDGVASQEGRILIMTTNHIEKLDPALIRPGRVDMKIEFQLASHSVLQHLFERMFEVFPEESPNSDLPDDQEEAAKVLKTLSAEFADSLPADLFSPAEVQGFLLKYKRRPREAVREVGGWVRVEVEKKEEAKRAREKAKGEEEKIAGKGKKGKLGATREWVRSVGRSGSLASSGRSAEGKEKAEKTTKA